MLRLQRQKLKDLNSPLPSPSNRGSGGVKPLSGRTKVTPPSADRKPLSVSSVARKLPQLTSSSPSPPEEDSPYKVTTSSVTQTGPGTTTQPKPAPKIAVVDWKSLGKKPQEENEDVDIAGKGCGKLCNVAAQEGKNLGMGTTTCSLKQGERETEYSAGGLLQQGTQGGGAQAAAQRTCGGTGLQTTQGTDTKRETEQSRGTKASAEPGVAQGPREERRTGARLERNRRTKPVNQASERIQTSDGKTCEDHDKRTGPAGTELNTPDAFNGGLQVSEEKCSKMTGESIKGKKRQRVGNENDDDEHDDGNDDEDRNDDNVTMNYLNRNEQRQHTTVNTHQTTEVHQNRIGDEGMRNEKVELSRVVLKKSLSEFEAGSKLNRPICNKITGKRVTQSSTYGRNSVTRQYVSRNWNRGKKDPLVKDNTNYGEVRRKKKGERGKNSGIQKSNSEEGTNAESEPKQTVENKEPGKGKIIYEPDEPEGPVPHELDEPDREKLKSSKELALRAKREER